MSRQRNRMGNARGPRGAILPMVAISLVGLCGFLALAVDLGMIAIARSQAQTAADSAALAATRTLDGGPSPKLSAAAANGLTAATANGILNRAISSGSVSVELGSYHYDTASQTFQPQFPPVAPDTYNLARATVTQPVNTAFANVFGVSAKNVTATATAAHRPRDISVILDFSGSMNNESDLWNNESYLGTVNNSPNNNDANVPAFGQYSDATNSRLRNTSSDPRIGKCNITQGAMGVPPLVDDFWQHGRNATQTARAFTAAPTSYATTPGGDNVLKKSGNTAAAYAQTVLQIDSNATPASNRFQQGGYASYTGQTFKGYTQGPTYWGKTFFIWPPDPNAASDWRRKFFGTNNNQSLWDASGNWKMPSGNYTINYAAILSWIKNTGPNPFPPSLRSGHVLYYNSIPDDVPASAYNHNNANSAITDLNQRFWKEYIDYALGVWRDPYGTIQQPQSPSCSIGPDWTWGTIKISAPPTNGAYMDFSDNPERPRHRMWFGPITMLQFLSDTGLFSGMVHDISTYSAKNGIAAALTDIENNHPNDLVSMIVFNRPQFSNDPANIGRFGQARYSLSRDYAGMRDSLWFPPNSSTSDIRPWTPSFQGITAAYGDYNSNTATHHGLMLAYNQFSGDTGLRASLVGGLGRKGAQRLVILETDGMANVNTAYTGSFVNSGLNSYYPIKPGQTITSAGYNQTTLLSVAQAICNKPDGTAGNAPGFSPNPGYPGFSTARKPVKIHTIVFGAIFETPSTVQDTSVALVQQISAIGGTTFPSSASDPVDGYKWCIGTNEERQAKLRAAFSRVTDDGASISLVQ